MKQAFALKDRYFLLVYVVMFWASLLNFVSYNSDWIKNISREIEGTIQLKSNELLLYNVCVNVCVKILCMLQSYILSYLLCNSGNHQNKYYRLTFEEHRIVELKLCLQPRAEIPSAQLSFMQVLWAH